MGRQRRLKGERKLGFLAIMAGFVIYALIHVILFAAFWGSVKILQILNEVPIETIALFVSVELLTGAMGYLFFKFSTYFLVWVSEIVIGLVIAAQSIFPELTSFLKFGAIMAGVLIVADGLRRSGLFRSTEQK